MLTDAIPSPENTVITVVGLGYVGIPLAIEFSKKYKVIGFDISPVKITQLLQSIDTTGEIPSKVITDVLLKSKEELEQSTGFYPTDKVEDIKDSDIYIIAVPTPVNSANRPNLTSLLSATKMVGKLLTKGNTVIYESTTYPGCTEEKCIPLLEKKSNLKCDTDFFVGYSPERINPGDKVNTLTKITKVISGSTEEAAEYINRLYKSIIPAGTYKASSIKVAEAAKVIENAQRDINIAFVNELAKIFNMINIDTTEVLKAAETKWNFLSFKPGLVGGHCIGVDPYYLAHKAAKMGYHPEIILAGRRLNDSMPFYIASEVLKLMVTKEIIINNSSVLVLGITFKENCPDVRNTKVIDVIRQLRKYGVDVSVYDPLAIPEVVEQRYGIKDCNRKPDKTFDGIILAVPHDDFKNFDVKKHLKENSIVYDCKSFLDKEIIDGRL
ncbi:MAG: nucleotide sugar dehydrogenase [Flavobacteriaceae bacterium]|jgi:UDP-N-acetyl-D-galactosamine dehydrogenase|nr:nucleotide sugar dehydrogenase [Flavobacteriaceae bacterium]